jgi:deoxyribodipyrimidine photo-lyase
MSPLAPRAIAWFRRDLRLQDQRMLAEALAAAAEVVPVFVVDPRIVAANAAAAPRLAWYRASIVALDAELRALGSGLVVLHGDPELVLPALAAATGATAVYAARDAEPGAVRRDAAVADRVSLTLVDDQRLLPDGSLRAASGGSYAVFTPFRRALEARLAEDPALLAEARPRLERLARAVNLPDGQGPGAFPDPVTATRLPTAGPAAALAQLTAFSAGRLGRYETERDRPGAGATSGISPYLRVGALSVRAAWRAALVGPRGDAWRRELAWREFFADRLAAGAMEPPGGGEEVQASLVFGAWRDGQTGIPLVDAGMRELAATGWMHNRARLVAAGFAVKQLGIPVERGESLFMERLLDGDLAQNRGNWRWVAGMGVGSAPWFRVLNPVVQARRFDPDAGYLRRWLPELVALPTDLVHEPWRAPAASRGGYPDPIVDLDAAREAVLARHRGTRLTASP